jgi:hypothetical protein
VPVELGDLPEWLAAIGTVGALGGALWQIRVERNRRIAQDARDREERRREQARKIACWPGESEDPGPIDPWWGTSTPIDLVNGSDEPVYNVVVSIVLVQGAGAPRTTEELKERAEIQHDAPRSTAAILVPGAWRVWVPGTGWDGGMGLRLGAEIAFTDRAGVSWIRRGTGALEELPKPTLEYFVDFGLYGPYDFQIPSSRL